MFNLYIHAARPRPAWRGRGHAARRVDGVIRQVRGTDAPLLADGFARLSVRSRRMRFLGTNSTLSAAELRYLERGRRRCAGLA